MPPARWIVLFTTRDISLKQANAILAEAGFRGVMRLDAVERIEAIPVLGTGKTDYKVLRKLVAERSHMSFKESQCVLLDSINIVSARTGIACRNCWGR